MEKLIENRTKQVIGSTNVFLEGTNQYCRLRECNFGDFITDSFINYVSTTIFDRVVKGLKLNYTIIV